MTNVEKLVEKWRVPMQSTIGPLHGAGLTEGRRFCAEELEAALAADREGVDPRAGLYKQVPTSCACGGNMAWVRIKESGAEEMVGCVCHTFADREGRQEPSGYLYRYADNHLSLKSYTRNGSNPVEQIPYWLAAQPIPAALAAFRVAERGGAC